ncbi:unnamed protein product [Parajaminaea phylloscopi]
MASTNSSRRITSNPNPHTPSQPPARETVYGNRTHPHPTSTTPTLPSASGLPRTSPSASSSTPAARRVAQIGQHLHTSAASPSPRTLQQDAMTTPQQFKQAPHKLLVIPGPIEVADDVLLANAHPSVSHVSPDFVPVFGDVIRMFRDVLLAPEAQPVITAGSGTLGWDHVAANVVEPGEDVLVLNSGYFGDSFAECLEVYGAKVTQLKAPIGSKPSLEDVEAELKKKKYKAVTFTHVDTSTGVLSDAKGLGEVVKRASPETILVLDGVCSVASEEIRMGEWGIDVVLTASQKGLGCPPGLMLLAASKKAINAFESRKTKPNSYYASWAKWIPVMKAYEAGTGAYFGTPPTNLIYAMHASLTTITSKPMEDTWALHVAASDRVKTFLKEELGLEQLVADPKKDGAHGMTAIKYPAGIQAADLLPRMVKRNVVIAAGLHKECKDTYFRTGHMNESCKRGDVDYLLSSLKDALAEAGYTKK